jgi:hypothetical protein
VAVLDGTHHEAHEEHEETLHLFFFVFSVLFVVNEFEV